MTGSGSVSINTLGKGVESPLPLHIDAMFLPQDKTFAFAINELKTINGRVYTNFSKLRISYPD